MKFFVFEALIVFFGFAVAWTDEILKTEYGQKTFETPLSHSDEPLKASLNCETLFVLDLSKNVLSNDVFDISIKKFLTFISKFCFKFRYTIIDENYPESCDGEIECKINITRCVDSFGCQTAISNMDYTNMTLSYSDKIYDNSSKESQTYFRYLKATLSAMNSCTDYSVLLLSNRIVYMNINDAFKQLIENSCIKFTAILLGRNDTDASTSLETAYEDIPNIKTLSFANYDCLSYLLYCILPCSRDETECVKSDVDDCHDFSSLTPNPFPETTLHVWFVEAFSRHLNNAAFGQVISGMRQGMQDYADKYNISHVRFRMVTSRNDINKACEHINFPTSDCQAGSTYVNLGENVGDDNNDTNDRLSLIPWSNALTNTRAGIFSVIILTNFATVDLITTKNNENLLGWIYVYNNTEAYEYYSATFKATKNFHVSSLIYSDVVTIVPIANDDSLSVAVSGIEKNPQCYYSPSSFVPDTSTETSESTKSFDATISNTQTTAAVVGTTYSANSTSSKASYFLEFIILFITIFNQ